jgi:hypothetical protein
MIGHSSRLVCVARADDLMDVSGSAPLVAVEISRRKPGEEFIRLYIDKLDLEPVRSAAINLLFEVLSFHVERGVKFAAVPRLGADFIELVPAVAGDGDDGLALHVASPSFVGGLA